MTLRAYARRLWVHEVAVDVSVQIARMGKKLTGPGAASRADQLVRAALSVSSNIAEACSRGSIPEFRRFLQYAGYGSGDADAVAGRGGARPGSCACHSRNRESSRAHHQGARALDRSPAAGQVTTFFCCVSVLRLCATPLCYAFVLRLCATPLCYVV